MLNLNEPINVEEMVLTKVRRFILQRLSKEFVLDVNVWQDQILEDIVIRVMEEQLAMKAGERIIKYPKDWREAFKDRWFPRWLKKRFPVEYKEYDAIVMFPTLLKDHPIPEAMRNVNYYYTFSEPGKILPKND